MKSLHSRSLVSELTHLSSIVLSLFLPLVGSPEIENVGSLNNPIDVPAGETTTIDALADDRPARPFPNSLKIEGVTRQARYGRCRVTSNGNKLNYTPDDGYDGRDSCQIEVCDSRDVCDKASVFLNVEGTSEPTPNPTTSPTDLPVSLSLCVNGVDAIWKEIHLRIFVPDPQDIRAFCKLRSNDLNFSEKQSLNFFTYSHLRPPAAGQDSLGARSAFVTTSAGQVAATRTKRGRILSVGWRVSAEDKGQRELRYDWLRCSG